MSAGSASSKLTAAMPRSLLPTYSIRFRTMLELKLLYFLNLIDDDKIAAIKEIRFSFVVIENKYSIVGNDLMSSFAT